MLLATGIDVVPLLLAMNRQPELWNQHELRREYPGTPHAECDDIWLRFQDLSVYTDGQAIADAHESICYPAWWALPQARQLIFWLMARVEGERLGRCLITRLAPGERILPHEDGGAHAAYYDRYHMVLQGFAGSVFRCGEESVQMRTGEVWWFQNAIEHEAINNSADDRIHLIVDIRSPRHA